MARLNSVSETPKAKKPKASKKNDHLLPGEEIDFSTYPPKSTKFTAAGPKASKKADGVIPDLMGALAESVKPSKAPKKPKPSAAGAHNPENAPEFMREVPVDLSAEEIAAKSQELVDAELKLEVQVSDKKAAVADLNAGIKGTKETIAALVAQLTTKKETRTVKCFERPMFSQNLVQIVRADSGTVVETRPMTLADRQEELL